MNPRGSHRIASFLPAATEACFCLDAWDEVVGVSHACDFPPAAVRLPRLTRPRVDPRLPSRELDAAVRRLGKNGGLYEIDEGLLAKIRPDLLVAQTQCRVCAVSPEDLRAMAERLEPTPRIVSLDAKTFEGTLGDLRRMGDAIDRKPEANQLVLRSWHLAKEIRGRVEGLSRPRVAVLDWVDPVMFAGNWVPDLVEMAGGTGGLVASGQPSRNGTWDEVRSFDPDVIVAAPCGRTLDETAAEVRAALAAPDRRNLRAVREGRVFVADGDAYFNRPGPRLVYAAAVLARTLHWDEVPPLPPAVEEKVRRL